LGFDGRALERDIVDLGFDRISAPIFAEGQRISGFIASPPDFADS
jgi:hypothetical protein